MENSKNIECSFVLNIKYQCDIAKCNAIILTNTYWTKYYSVEEN